MVIIVVGLGGQWSLESIKNKVYFEDAWEK
jgi:hypothetical protein